MKFNTKIKPRDAADTSSAASAASNRGPPYQLQQTLSHSAIQRRGTAESYDRATSYSLSRSNSNIAPPSSAGSRLAHRELPLPPPQLSSLPQSPCYDHSSGRGYDDNPDSPTDPYCASNTYPPARSYYSAAAGVANESSRLRSSSNPHTYGADSEVSPISSESSSHASRTRNLLGLTINTDAVAAQSRRFVRRPTIASIGQEDENTPSLVHDEERNENEDEGEPDETVPVCESPSPLDIGNSPTIRKLDDPFNVTYQEPTMLQSPPDTQEVRDTPTAAPGTPAYHADEILQIVQQALLQTQASTQAISVEAIQAAVINEMNCRR
ncbi:hypothetical protein KEM56_005057, partial [Ascosphaera pollenicola]